MSEAKKVEWLVGCTKCDEGMSNRINELLKTEKKSNGNPISRAAAYQLIVEEGNKQIGADFFKVDAIKKAYERFNNLGTNVPKPKAERSGDSQPVVEQEPAANDSDRTLSIKELEAYQDFREMIHGGKFDEETAISTAARDNGFSNPEMQDIIKHGDSLGVFDDTPSIVDFAAAAPAGDNSELPNEITDISQEDDKDKIIAELTAKVDELEAKVADQGWQPDSSESYEYIISALQGRIIEQQDINPGKAKFGELQKLLIPLAGDLNVMTGNKKIFNQRMLTNLVLADISQTPKEKN